MKVWNRNVTGHNKTERLLSLRDENQFLKDIRSLSHAFLGEQNATTFGRNGIKYILEIHEQKSSDLRPKRIKISK
jgi:hypothetical protein